MRHNRLPAWVSHYLFLQKACKLQMFSNHLVPYKSLLPPQNLAVLELKDACVDNTHSF